MAGPTPAGATKFTLCVRACVSVSVCVCVFEIYLFARNAPESRQWQMTKTLDLRRAEMLETLVSHERKRGRTGTSRGQGKMA